MEKSKSFGRGKRQFLAAVVLGTALATMGSSAQAATSVEVSGQAITDISRYCTACWRNARLPVDRWNDCTQEVFQRLLERVDPAGWKQVLSGEGEERKEFLRAIDAVKKRSQRERQRLTLAPELAVDTQDSVNRARSDERDAVRQVASELLSPRQQRILQMTCEGWSVADMATELSTTPERISDEKYKAVQKLREFFQQHPEMS
ncbi:MAG: hypothetical protein L0Z53_23380 [Acidobacteriales bacterium]|nr:hypothetical protein [Terriglobales bacterium]